MIKDELLARLQDIEWDDFEVKEAYSELPKNVWETVSAFANTSGGWLVLGVSQQGKKFSITGLKNPEKTEQDFLNTLRGEKFNLRLQVKSQKYAFPEGTVLAFYIAPSDRKPVYYNTQANTFIRSGSGDQRATKEEIDTLYRNQAFGTQLSQLAPGTSATDLHTPSLVQYREFMQRMVPTLNYNRLTEAEFLQKLRIADGHVLTYSGLLFLGNNSAIQAHFPDFRVDYLEIPSTDYATAQPRYTFRLPEAENLWDYYFALFERLRRQIDVPFQLTVEGAATEDLPQVRALREALVNMLMHADYFSSAKARIRVFTDRLEFWNPGGTPKPLAKIMQEDLSLPRNPILAKLFRLVRLADNAGFGFEKMREGWLQHTGHPPLFDSDFDATRAVFPLHRKAEKETPPATAPKSDSEEIRNKLGGSWVLVRRKLGERLGERLGEKLGKNEWKILEQIWQDATVSIPMLAEAIGISTTAVENNLQKLRNKDFVERVGPAKGGYWRIKLDD